MAICTIYYKNLDIWQAISTAKTLKRWNRIYYVISLQVLQIDITTTREITTRKICVLFIIVF
jgi:hypothetical protein